MSNRPRHPSSLPFPPPSLDTSSSFLRSSPSVPRPPLPSHRTKLITSPLPALPPSSSSLAFLLPLSSSSSSTSPSHAIHIRGGPRQQDRHDGHSDGHPDPYRHPPSPSPSTSSGLTAVQRHVQHRPTTALPFGMRPTFHPHAPSHTLTHTGASSSSSEWTSRHSLSPSKRKRQAWNWRSVAIVCVSFLSLSCALIGLAYQMMPSSAPAASSWSWWHAPLLPSSAQSQWKGVEGILRDGMRAHDKPTIAVQQKATAQTTSEGESNGAHRRNSVFNRQAPSTTQQASIARQAALQVQELSNLSYVGSASLSPTPLFAVPSLSKSSTTISVNTPILPLTLMGSQRNFLPFANTMPVPLMMQTPFPQSQGYPLFSEPTSTRYSAFYCVGDRGRENSEADRTCRFQNLCLNTSTMQWIFYQDPQLRDQMPVLLDHGRIYTEFPPHFVNLRAAGNPEDAKWWSPLQVYQELPAHALIPRQKHGRPEVFLLYQPYLPSNFGHVLGDDLYPLFNLMQTFGMLTNDAQLLVLKGCESIYDEFRIEERKACESFLIHLTAGFTSRPVISLANAGVREQLGMHESTPIMCFENVLVGMGPHGFQSSLGKASTWWQFRQYYLSNLGLSQDATPRKQRITVNAKTSGKHALHNSNELVEYLKNTFPEHEVEAIDLYSIGSWQQELQLMQNTTVLITPCGASSMSAVFLPVGAALIVVDYWNTKKANTIGMEEKLWSNLGYIRSYSYPFTEDEVVLTEVGKLRSRVQDLRDFGHVKVDLARMERLVRDALQHAIAFTPPAAH